MDLKIKNDIREYSCSFVAEILYLTSVCNGNAEIR
jgi:hypothetical protein